MGVCTAKNYHFFYEVPNLFNQRSNFAFNLHVPYCPIFLTWFKFIWVIAASSVFQQKQKLSAIRNFINEDKDHPVAYL